MKKLFASINYIFIAIFVFLSGCQKDDEILASVVEIKNEVIEIGLDYLKISAEYSYPEELKSVDLHLSTNTDMSGATVHGCSVEGKNISIEIQGLQDGVQYYYCYEYDNGYSKEKSAKMSFTMLASTGMINGYYWVDLGLPSGLKWATCNVGADQPEDYGNYYAWGEIEPKDEYTEENSITYGVLMGYYDISGNPQYDAARANWGSTWRMPTEEECRELVYECTWQWTTQNGVYGVKVTGPNGNYIFLPAAGCRDGSSLYHAGEYGGYWSSTPNEGYSSYYAYGLDFSSEDHRVFYYGNRLHGHSVRPVSE